MVAVGADADELVAAYGLTGFDIKDELAADIALFNGRAVLLRLFGRNSRHRAADGEARCAERVFARAGMHGQHAVFILILALKEPEGFVVVGILIADVGVDGGQERDLAVIIRRHAAAQREKLRTGDGNEAFKADTHRALFPTDGEFAAQHARVHIQHAGEGHHVILIQVDILPVDAYTQGDDVHGVDDLAEILRVAVFPPAYARLIRKPYACQIRSAMAVAAVLFFKITAHAHVSVADGGHRLGKAHIILVQLIFNKTPGIISENRFHSSNLCFQKISIFKHARGRTRSMSDFKKSRKAVAA